LLVEVVEVEITTVLEVVALEVLFTIPIFQ
jgi:hypothetical protein